MNTTTKVKRKKIERRNNTYFQTILPTGEKKQSK